MGKTKHTLTFCEQDLYFNYNGYPLETFDSDMIRDAFANKELVPFSVCNEMAIQCYLVETLQNGTPKMHDIHIMYQTFKHTAYPLKHFNIESLLEVLESLRFKRYVKNHTYKLYIDIVYETEDDSIESSDSIESDETGPILNFDKVIKANVEALNAVKDVEQFNKKTSGDSFAYISEKNICMVKDLLELAEKLKSSNPEQQVIFVDSDYNQYFIKKDIKLKVIGEALDLDRDTMEENDSNYDEDCIVLEVL